MGTSSILCNPWFNAKKMALRLPHQDQLCSHFDITSEILTHTLALDRVTGASLVNPFRNNLYASHPVDPTLIQFASYFDLIYHGFLVTIL